MKKIFNFKKQLSLGLKGEELFIDSYPYLKPKKSDKFENDIYLEDGSGYKIELKTDYYSMNKTRNMFMEQYGNIERKRIGGPWKALKDNNDFFVYLYYPDKTFFWFSTKRLVDNLDKMISNGELAPKLVQNVSYTTKGFLVDRVRLFHLLFKLDRF